MKYAIDCEMVGVTGGSELARVAVVDENLTLVYDQIVRPVSAVTDYRTGIHGLTQQQILNGRQFSQVQNEVRNIISGNIIIGHSVDVDLAVLKLSHPSHLIRDVSTYQAFQNYGGKPSLKNLARDHLGTHIQQGYHKPAEDAKTCMQLYKKYEHAWR